MTDHLGSLTMLIDDGGDVVAEQAYDAWGNVRSASDWSQGLTTGGIRGYTKRGYTLHEHLEEFNLIHMNGRVYCPTTMQFLSPDPYIQAPSLSHNYNRYSYCLNNPLLFSDPSGYKVSAAMIPLMIDYYLYCTEFGGQINIGGGGGGGSFAFTSNEQAFEYGAAHNDNFGSWEHTAHGSRENSEQAFKVYNAAHNYGKSLASVLSGRERVSATVEINRRPITVAAEGGMYYVSDLDFGVSASSRGDNYGWVETGFSHTGKTAYVAGLANKGRGAVEWEYLRQAKFNRSLSGNFSQPVKHSLRAISKTGKVLGVAGTVATYGVAGYQVATGTDNTSTWVDVGVTTGVVVVGIISTPVAIGAGIIYGGARLFYGD